MNPTTINGVPYFFEKVRQHLVSRGEADQPGRLVELLGGRMRLCNSGGAALADAAAAKAKYQSMCDDCHEPEDFAGRAVADLEAKIKAISAGTMKHKKKYTITDAEAKDLAAFLSAGK